MVRLDWAPGGDGLLLQVTNRIQNRLDLLVADPQTGVVTRLLREDGIPWVDRSSIKWLDDDRFLWFSTRDGFKHLYVYSADGTASCRTTSQHTCGPIFLQQPAMKAPKMAATLSPLR